MMDIMAQQKDCDVLAGLFQHIVTDLKVCMFSAITDLSSLFHVYF